MHRTFVFTALACASLCFATMAHAKEPLRLPRFVSLKAEEANLRTGPGIRYPVRWVYWKKWLPVEIIEEYDHWRKIRDVDGESGWIHKSLLSGRRTVFIQENHAELRQHPEKDAPALLRAEQGVVGDAIACESRWCRIQIQNVKGWLPKTSFWGAYDQEIFD
jgi:SH3-like domain-containing protein